jgi:hypothetical protein
MIIRDDDAAGPLRFGTTSKAIRGKAKGLWG